MCSCSKPGEVSLSENLAGSLRLMKVGQPPLAHVLCFVLFSTACHASVSASAHVQSEASVVKDRFESLVSRKLAGNVRQFKQYVRTDRFRPLVFPFVLSAIRCVRIRCHCGLQEEEMGEGPEQMRSRCCSCVVLHACAVVRGVRCWHRCRCEIDASSRLFTLSHRQAAASSHRSWAC